MNSRSRLPAILLAAGLGFLAGCPTPTAQNGMGRPAVAGPLVADSKRFTTGLFDGCPPEGSGGDAELNRLKNRDLPPPAYEPISLVEVVANRLLPEGETSHDRDRWSRGTLAEVARWENRGASIEGYLIKAKQMQPETCNCKDTRHRDYHLSLVAGPGDDRSQSLIAEVSPRLLPAHPNWRLRILSHLAKDGARVRLSGWLMWDQEHPDQVGNTRGTQWEIHPIHLIEVWSGGRWRNLDG